MEIYHSNVPEYLAPEGLDAYHHFLASGSASYLIIECDDRVVACGGIELTPDGTAVELVYGLVHRQFHRRGLGTALLAVRLSLLECGKDAQTI